MTGTNLSMTFGACDRALADESLLSVILIYFRRNWIFDRIEIILHLPSHIRQMKCGT